MKPSPTRALLDEDESLISLRLPVAPDGTQGTWQGQAACRVFSGHEFPHREQWYSMNVVTEVHGVSAGEQADD